MTETRTDPLDAPDLGAPAIKPCPFCGGGGGIGEVFYSERFVEEQGWGQRKFFFVNCTLCGSNNKGLRGHQSPTEAVALWNRRAALAEATDAEIEEVVKALRAEEWKGHAPSWEKESPSSQQYWRDSARSAVSAFLKARSGM